MTEEKIKLVLKLYFYGIISGCNSENISEKLMDQKLMSIPGLHPSENSELIEFVHKNIRRL